MSPAPSEALLAPGRHLGAYRVGEPLASGGMGTVFRGTHGPSGTAVALKAVASGGPDLRLRLRREARALARVAHDNVVRVRELVEAEGTPVLVMELVEGPSLSQALGSRPLPLPRVDALARGIMAGVAALHGAGVLHRDLKPANVILAGEGTAAVPVIVDLGLARFTDQPAHGLTRTGLAVGTPGFMAPEQIRGQPVDARADVFALGALLYELATGQRAFPGDDLLDVYQRTCTGAFPPPQQVRTGLPPRICDALLGALHPDPDRRVPDVPTLAAVWRGEAWLEGVGADLVGSGSSPTWSDLPAMPGAGRVPVHLPPPPADRTVGRDQELADLLADLATHRLVTVVGPGGIGKTRLATAAARELAGTSTRGAWFVDLAAAHDEDAVVAAVAAALDLETAGADPAARVGRALAGRGPVLLLLDNLEQVVAPAARLISDWLTRAPDLTVLATSRAPLRLPQERPLSLGPLPPHAALQLLADRARLVRPDFAVSVDDREVAERLVARLDGMALAIELAAARLRVLTLRQLEERLAAAGLDALRDRRRQSADRHRSLRALVAWSWDLLAPWERAAMVAASTFAGGFDLAAAEAVLDLSPWPDAPFVDEVIERLLDQSMLHEVPGPAPRFATLVTIRQYAAEADPDARRAAADRHARHFAALGDRCRRRWPHQALPAPLQATLRQEADNLDAALAHALARGDGDLAARLLPGTFSARPSASQAADCRQADAVLALGVSDPVLDLSTRLIRRRAGHSAGLPEVEASLRPRAEVLGDPWWLARAVADDARAAARTGRREEALELYVEARARAEDLGDRHGSASARIARAQLLARMDRHDEATRALAELRPLLADLPDAQELQTRFHLFSGDEARRSGRLDDARAAFEACRDLARDRSLPTMHAEALGRLAMLSAREGRVRDAVRVYEAAVAAIAPLGAAMTETGLRCNLADQLRALDRPDEALAHLQAAARLARDSGRQDQQASIACTMAEVRLEQDRPAEAREHLVAARAAAAASRSPLLAAFIEAVDARAAARLGQVDLPRFEAAAAAVAAAGSTWYQGLVLAFAAEAAADAGLDPAPWLAQARACAEASGAGAGSELGRLLAALGGEAPPRG